MKIRFCFLRTWVDYCSKDEGGCTAVILSLNLKHTLDPANDAVCLSMTVRGTIMRDGGTLAIALLKDSSGLYDTGVSDSSRSAGRLSWNTSLLR